MSLREYEKKRNFAKTPEPAPDKESEAGPSLRFVIHKHRATRMHFDLRLEWDGSYKSWAVPKGPSLNPTDRNLAVHVEDHPISYGEFEGNIPKGQYGAGSVMLWDRGTFYERHSDPNNREENERNLAKGFREGKVTFVLQGKKLKGEFYLVQTKKDDKSWLLFKKQDKFASFDPRQIFDETSVKTGRTMEEIAEETAVTRLPQEESFEEVPRFFQPMKPMRSKYLPDEDTKWVFEKPLNGYRAIAIVGGAEGVRIVSGWGRDYGERFGEIKQSLEDLGGSLVFDGEITSSSQTEPKELKGPRDHFRYQIYDFLHENGRSLRETTLRERRVRLEKVARRFGKYLSLVPQAESITKVSKLAGPKDSKELIAKDKDSVYDGGLSQSWLIFKVDAKPKTAKEGKGKSKKDQIQRGSDKVVITHPRKILWPKERFTKQDLVDYYDKISGVILPYLKDRPLNLHRHPYGITGGGFYHKNITEYHPSWFQTIAVLSTTEEKTINYAMCQNRESLLYLVNQGSIEINPWMSKVSDLDRPEFGVIDLDPHGLAFPKLTQIALRVREICEEAKVRTLVKTSGQAGIHILVPTAAKYTFDEVRDFCHLVCKIVHHEYKSIASLERNPGRRGGRMYLDFMQNRRGQTIAAPYCVRPKPGIPVSTPLSWDELVPELSPLQFTVFTIPERLRRIGDLWQGAFETGVDLKKAQRKLEKLEATLT
jgi:bifunctional non-homologous end joining protein LigD